MRHPTFFPEKPCLGVTGAALSKMPGSSDSGKRRISPLVENCINSKAGAGPGRRLGRSFDQVANTVVPLLEAISAFVCGEIIMEGTCTTIPSMIIIEDYQTPLHDVRIETCKAL